MQVEAKVRAFKGGFVELGETARTLRKGIFDIKADSYTEAGIPFIRISNLRDGIVDDSNIAYISESTHKSEVKTEVTRGDLVLSKTAYPSASYVQLKTANVSQECYCLLYGSYLEEAFSISVPRSLLEFKRGLCSNAAAISRERSASSFS